jgi:hypothetical protein
LAELGACGDEGEQGGAAEDGSRVVVDVARNSRCSIGGGGGESWHREGDAARELKTRPRDGEAAVAEGDAIGIGSNEARPLGQEDPSIGSKYIDRKLGRGVTGNLRGNRGKKNEIEDGPCGDRVRA